MSKENEMDKEDVIKLVEDRMAKLLEDAKNAMNELLFPEGREKVVDDLNKKIDDSIVVQAKVGEHGGNND